MTGPGSHLQLSSAVARRHFLARSSTGIGTAALAALLNPRPASADQIRQFAPKAQRIIWLTQAGAPSQLDLFDYKPQLKSLFGQNLPDSVRGGQRLTGMTAKQDKLPVAPSLYRFRPYGECGTWFSEILPHTARLADDL